MGVAKIKLQKQIRNKYRKSTKRHFNNLTQINNLNNWKSLKKNYEKWNLKNAKQKLEEGNT